MLRSYMKLAKICLDERLPLFNILHKHHYFHHEVYRMQEALAEGKLVLNPTCFSCSLDEDFVGRLSRLSRRVNIRQLELRTLQRYLVAARNTERRKARATAEARNSGDP
jgi:hypothetical protein